MGGVVSRCGPCGWRDLRKDCVLTALFTAFSLSLRAYRLAHRFWPSKFLPERSSLKFAFLTESRVQTQTSHLKYVLHVTGALFLF
jgi:hypothetical protein